MPHILKNNNVELHIDLPLENYTHSRFDWTGKITAVFFKGILVSGTERSDRYSDPILGQGFYNEFGIDSGLGYNETEVGGWFHKIGVGLLQRDEAEYNFATPYPVQSADFNSTIERESIRTQCIAPLVNGYAYELHKEIVLIDNGFELNYCLENTGTKTIDTTEYNHNFLSVNNDFIGQQYQLVFPFPLQPSSFDAVVNPEDLVHIEENDIGFHGTPEAQFFFSNLSGGKTVPAQWQLLHKNTNIVLSETGDFDTASINVWGWSHVVSPELFIQLSVSPGHSKKWKRTYRLKDLNGATPI
ncbi:MAG: hypothetical protein P1U56_22050 [Saprospiraceae bacterium]|nr:hypothetical protein [Saprospiraceae bacterium]